MQSIRLVGLAAVLALTSVATTALAEEGSEGAPTIPRLLQQLKHPKAWQRQEALDELRTLRFPAKDAIPVITNLLRDRNGPIRRTAAETLATMGPGAEVAMPDLIGTATHDSHAPARAAAIEALVAISAAVYSPDDCFDAHLFVPVTPKVLYAIVKALQDRKALVRRSAIEAIERVGIQSDHVMPALVAAIKDKDAQVRSGVAKALVKIGDEARPALPALRRLLADRVETVRVDAAVALWQLEKQAGLVISVLIPALRPTPMEPTEATQHVTELAALIRSGEVQRVGECDPDADAFILHLLDNAYSDYQPRHEAIVTLGEIGPPAAAAIPALTALLKDRSRDLRRDAALALWKIDRRQGPTIVDALLAGLPEEGPSDFGYEITELLAAIGPAAKPVVPVLLRTLQEKTKVRDDGTTEGGPDRQGILMQSSTCTSSRTIIEALLAIDRETARATLMEFLNSAAADVRMLALESLWKLDPNNDRVLSGLVTELKNPTNRAHALHFLAELEPAARCLLPNVREFLKHPDGKVRMQAARTIWKLDGNPDDLLAVHLAALKDESARLEAIIALGEMGAAAKRATPLLKEFLHDSSEMTRLVAAMSLASIDPQAKLAIQTLVDSLTSRDRMLTELALACLEDLGPAAAPAVTELEALLKDRNPNIRRAAATVLKKIESSAPIR